MNTNSIKTKHESSKVLVELHAQHQKFHQFLDRLAAKTNDINIINLLIEIRRVNIECLSKYSGLLSKQQYDASANAKTISHTLSNLRENDMTLWNIHGQLARLVPIYNKALSNRELSQVSRMIISSNNDQLIKLKEQLLHPLPAVELA